MSDTKTTLQLIEEAREVMHDLIIQGGNWKARYDQEQVIHELQRKLADEKRQLQLLIGIFS